MLENQQLLLPVVIDTWCYENCAGKWRVASDDKTVDLSFSDFVDATMFKLGRWHALILS